MSQDYLKKAQASPRKIPQAQKLLVVLDLNGTLCVRDKETRKDMVKRPGVEPLLEYLFDNHVVMICTSATIWSANGMVSKLLTDQQRNKLVTIRARDTFGLTKAQFGSKVQVYKNLEDIWSDPYVDNAFPHSQGSWDTSNTVLIDDSILKAKAQPHNLIQVPEFEWNSLSGTKNEQKVARAREEAIMRSVRDKLETLKYQANVACLIREWQEGQKEAPGVVDEKVDQSKGVALKNDAAAQSDGAAENYPTPTSLDETSSHEDEDEYETA